MAQGPLDPIDSFEAIPYSGWIPCDPIVAAGTASLVAMVNSKMVIFDKKGAALFQQNLSGAGGFWGGQGASSTVAEPWVIFDPNSQRFIALATDHGESRKGMLYLAVSKSANPVASTDWYKYGLERSSTHQEPGFVGAATAPDFARVGVDGDAIYVTSIHFAKDGSLGAPISHAEIFGLAKGPLLGGGPIQIIYDEPVLTGPRFFTIHPAVVFEPAPAMVLVQANSLVPSSEVMVHAIAGGNRTSFPVPVAPFDRPPSVPQPGGAAPLLNLDARLTSAVLRNGSLWTTHAIRDPAVDSESLVRWYQFDGAGLPAGPATLIQSGNVDPGPGLHTWLPHLNVDDAGSMAVGFSMGGASQFTGIAYTGRTAADPAGTTRPVRIARSGDGAYRLEGWGESSGLAIDPDGRTFWLFHEYPTAASQWATFASSFQVAPRPRVAIATDDFESGTFTGGSGTWVGPWVVSGDAVTLTSSGPAEGAGHVRLRRDNGLIQRVANVSGAASLQLSFRSKISSFEGSDRAEVRVSTDGVQFTRVWEFTSIHSDNVYHYHPVDLSGLLPATQLYLTFDAGMDSQNDSWFLDDIRISGSAGNLPPIAEAGPDRNISDSDDSGSELVLFDASDSVDSDGTIIAYTWLLNGVDVGSAPSLALEVPVGTWNVTLVVEDDDGATDTDSFVLTVTAPAIEVFTNSFETGTLGSWTQDGQNDWFASNQRAFQGAFSATVDGSASDALLATPVIDLMGRGAATITFAWFIGYALDNGEYLACDVSVDGGVGWSEVGRLAGKNGDKPPEGSWQSVSIEVASGSAGNVRLRFRGKMNATDEAAHVDSVRVIAH